MKLKGKALLSLLIVLTLTVQLFAGSAGAAYGGESLSWDYEENAVIMDPETTHELEQMFERDKLKSVYLTPEEWDRFRTPWQKFRGWFRRLLTPWL